jgi:dienelactone hydrolase
MRHRPGLLVLLVLAAAPARAATPLPGDAPIERFLAADVRTVSAGFLGGATTLDGWQKKLPRLRQEYLDMLGLWPLPEKTPLRAAVTGIVPRGGVVVEKLHYQSRPGLYVTANLYRPKAPRGRLPAVLYLCGHSGRGRDGNKTAFQDHGMWFARNGYVCLVLDTLQLGEVAGKHHGTYNLGRWWWHAAGYTPAGVECWNGVRGIDYLAGRADVDAGRIGVTGISGGGASTVWVAAADERVKAAAPVSGMSDLESYVSHKVVNGHCDCMFLVNAYRWEWATIAALIAPRPLLFANSDDDRIFPMDGNRRVIARLRQVYQLFGKPASVDDHVSKGGHAYRPDLRKRVFTWFNLHLKGDKGPVKDADDPPLPGRQLRVFPEDADLPKDALNARIDEVFVPRAAVKPPADGEFDGWKQSLMRKLRARCFRTFPDRVAAPRAGFAEAGEAAAGGALVNSEGGLSLRVGPPAVRAAAGARDGLLVVLGEGEDEDKGVPAWAAQLAGQREVQLLSPRGVGKGRWTRTSPPNYVERSHALLGRTVDQGRVYDVAAAARWLRAVRPVKRWTVAGKGPAGVIAAYAALFEPGIVGVTVVDPPASHRDGPYFLGVLRVLDVPEALGLLAPRPLTLVGARGKAFDATAEVYKRAGAAGRLTRRPGAGRD